MEIPWLKDISPWVQGLFGGAGATLLWEAFLKPAAERRSLAHVLAEEIAHNLQYAAGQRIYLNHNPKGIPYDFALSRMVFDAIAPRIGELPEHVADIMLIYRHVESLNALPGAFSNAFDAYRVAQTAGGGPRTEEHKRDLETMLGIYKDSLERLVNLSNALLPKLRRKAIPYYRPDLRLRRKPTLSLDDLAADVERLVQRRVQQGQGS
jgi:hypothetical protein